VVDELVIDKALPPAPRLQDAGLLRLRPDHRLANPGALESDVSGNENGLTTRVIVAPPGQAFLRILKLHNRPHTHCMLLKVQANPKGKSALRDFCRAL
jgi:hypothetical protein